MQKIITFIYIGLVAILLSACSKKEIIPIDLTKDNFKDYIILDVKISDYEKESQTGWISRYEYRGKAKLQAKARLKKDVKLENAIIKGKIITGGMRWAGNVYDFSLEFDKDGVAEYTEEIVSGEFGIMPPEKPTFGDSIETFKYYTDVQKDDFVFNGVLLNVSGKLYE